MRRLNWRFLLVAVGFSTMHFLMSAILFGLLFSAGMERFDNGGTPGAWERYAEVLLGTLHLPLVFIHQFTPLRVPARFEMVLVCVDSLLWGFATAWVVNWLWWLFSSRSRQVVAAED